MKTAICQVGHPWSLESLVIMLDAVGYRCKILNHALRDQLKSWDCDTIVDAQSVAKSWNEALLFGLREAGPQDLMTCDLYVDTKAHRNGPKIWDHRPHLENKTLWYRINGGRPQNVPGKGEELNPPCPVLTPSRWYGDDCVTTTPSDKKEGFVTRSPCRSYSCWPPFARWYQFDKPRSPNPNGMPFGLTHNVSGWGYGDVAAALRVLGVQCYGSGSPAGLALHDLLPEMLSTARAYVHMKANDAPGYALYEAIAAGCPVIISRRFVDCNAAQELFEDGITCLLYDRTDAEGQIDVATCVEEVKQALLKLSDNRFNQIIGENAKKRLKSLMWNRGVGYVTDSVTALQTFMTRHFG